MNCLNPKCENTLPDGIRSTRKFCSDACRQAYFRMQHQQDQAQGRTFTEMLTELEEMRTQVRDQAEQITGLEQEVTRLLAKLDIERRFLEDHDKRGFKTWLKKQPAGRIGDLGQRIRSDDLLPAAGSRAQYIAHLRKNKYSPDDLHELDTLWKLMLLA